MMIADLIRTVFAVVASVLAVALIAYKLYDDHYCKRQLVEGNLKDKQYASDVFKENVRSNTSSINQYIMLLLGVIISGAAPGIADQIMKMADYKPASVQQIIDGSGCENC